MNKSKYFHVVDDVLEGCAPYAMKELLKYLVSQQIVTLDQINDQIEHFPYSPLDARNKPTVIHLTTFHSLDHSLKQKGTILCTCS